jgi:hypothetical protein
MTTTKPTNLAPASTYTIDDVRDLIARRRGPHRVPDRFKIITDTSDFFKIDYNDVIILGNTPYLAQRYEREGRFGLDDEPKYWVRRAVNLLDGSTRILKLVFHESFESRVGDVVFKCFRSPAKEARILKLVAEHPCFMHGTSVKDEKGNLIRILEYIPGKVFDTIVSISGKDHEDYFHNYFPDFLKQFIVLSQAILFLHEHGEKHGDIRRDHIIVDREKQENRWIDFDYNYMHGENFSGYDLHGLGNMLLFIAGRGDVTVQDLYHHNRPVFEKLYREDLNIIFKNRVANLQKIYPYIPDALNNILLHFSFGANIFYENTGQFINDLEDALQDL